MSFALLIIGITLVVAAVRGTHLQLISLVAGDFSGPGNFWYWVVALLLIGSIGYVPRLKPISDGFLVLLILAILLAAGQPGKPGGGFFKQFTEALGTTQSNTGKTGAGVSINLTPVSS